MRKRATSEPSLMRFEGVVNAGGELLRSRISSALSFGGVVDVMSTMVRHRGRNYKPGL